MFGDLAALDLVFGNDGITRGFAHPPRNANEVEGEISSTLKMNI